jgi:hypothetical protein
MIRELISFANTLVAALDSPRDTQTMFVLRYTRAYEST